MTQKLDNPFAVQTPEDMLADDVVDLFVDVFADFHHVRNAGNSFLNGPRGSGKSMMFRYLEPDCQKLALNVEVQKLPFFGVYVPIKNTDLKLTELQRLENTHARTILNEHFLASFIAVRLFASLVKADIKDPQGDIGIRLAAHYEKDIRTLLLRSGADVAVLSTVEAGDLQSVIENIQDIFVSLHSNLLGYFRKLAFTDEPVSYSGPTFAYLDFIYVLIKGIKKLGFLPGGPVYLLIDDADNLSRTQAQILNSWVSCRTSQDVSLKISTQMRYPTFVTSTGQTIDSPHDFSEVNISSVYTSRKNHYFTRVADIVNRRLAKYGIDADAHQFFPSYDKQETLIRKLEEKIRREWNEKGRGFRAADDVARYARPEYIRGLQGKRKSGSTYKYAGFDQLVHLSSGVIRYFLESASLMYGEARAQSSDGDVSYIDPSIQDKVIRDQANEFLYSEFDRWSADEDQEPSSTGLTRKLRNLILALGGTFHQILLSDRSERRVFSIALSDEPDEELLAVLRLGVRYGYFHESTIGNKEGTGRTRLFILSRRLAPVFTLDPTSFAGYKFVTCAVLHEAMNTPKSFLRRVRSSDMDELFNDPQLALPLEG